MEEHEAIIVGAGTAGLAAAGKLSRRGFEVLTLERGEAVGMRWRERYEGLRLNTMSALSSLPGYRMPRSLGRYPRREDFVGYLEEYAARLRLSIRFGVELEHIDRRDEQWRLQTSAGTLRARYVVIATGYDAVPQMPDWPGREGFAGTLMHAADFRSAASYAGQEVLIVGAGNTGVDIAGHLLAAGAQVALSMRTPPNIFPREWGRVPLQPLAIVGEHQPAKVADVIGLGLQRAIFGDLSRHGIPRAPEGYESRYRRTLVGAAVDDGFVAALKAGRTRIVAPIESFEAHQVTLADGTRLAPETVICATGYGRGLEPLVGELGVLRGDGLPICHRGAPTHPRAPRLYFAGFWGGNGGQLRWSAIHARRIARAATRDRQARLVESRSRVAGAGSALVS